MHTGLFTRLSIGLTLILLLSLSTLAFLLLKDRHQQFINERTQQAIGQVKTLANGSLDALITKDYELLERWVTSVMSGDYYLYAYLSSPDGTILTHSDVVLTGSKVKSSGVGTSALVKVKLQYQSREANEVIYPAIVGNKTIAYAHLAWSEDDIKFIKLSFISPKSSIAASTHNCLSIENLGLILNHVFTGLLELVSEVQLASSLVFISSVAFVSFQSTTKGSVVAESTTGFVLLESTFFTKLVASTAALVEVTFFAVF